MEQALTSFSSAKICLDLWATGTDEQVSSVILVKSGVAIIDILFKASNESHLAK